MSCITKIASAPQRQEGWRSLLIAQINKVSLQSSISIISLVYCLNKGDNCSKSHEYVCCDNKLTICKLRVSSASKVGGFHKVFASLHHYKKEMEDCIHQTSRINIAQSKQLSSTAIYYTQLQYLQRHNPGNPRNIPQYNPAHMLLLPSPNLIQRFIFFTLHCLYTTTL